MIQLKTESVELPFERLQPVTVWREANLLPCLLSSYEDSTFKHFSISLFSLQVLSIHCNKLSFSSTS